MKNKEMNEQQPKAQCSICGVMRCATKWLLAAAFVSLMLQLFVAVSWMLLYGNSEMPRWCVIWLSSTLMAMILAFAAALIGWFKDWSPAIRDALRCA